MVRVAIINFIAFLVSCYDFEKDNNAIPSRNRNKPSHRFYKNQANYWLIEDNVSVRSY